MHIRQEGIYQYVRQQGIILQGLADACHSDEDRLREVEERPKDVLREHGIHVPMDLDVNIVLNTRDTFHLVMHPDPNQALRDEALMAVIGGSVPNTASSAATVGTFPSTVGTLSSVGCARVYSNPTMEPYNP